MDQSILNSLLETLELAEDPSNQAQQQVVQRFQVLNQHENLLLYLVYVFQDKENLANKPTVRERAGLVLKQVFRTRCDNLNPQHVRTVRDQLVETVKDPNKRIRETSGNVLTFIIQKTHLQNNFDAIGNLTGNLVTALQVGTSNSASSSGSLTQQQQQDLERLDGSFSCLTKICEDACDAMKQAISQHLMNTGPRMGGGINGSNGPPDVESLPEAQKQFLQFCAEKLLPTVFQFGNMSAPLVCRKYSVQLANHFALAEMLETSPFQEILGHLLPAYFQMVERLASDEDTDVLHGVVKGMAHLLNKEKGYDLIGGKQAPTVLNFMLKHSQHPNEKIRIEACDFWSSAVRWDNYWTGIKDLLPQLVPILLQNMKYTETDYCNMYDRDDDQDAKDHQQDIQPRFHESRNQHGAGDDDDDDSGPSNAWGTEWTVRKAAANSLDTMAANYGSDVMDLVLPIISTHLQSTDWETQESAVLAIGAIGVGCFELMCPHLPQVFELLVTKTVTHEKPLLRSISCWCMARYGYWVCENRNVSIEVLKALLQRMLDRSKRVQEAACSAFATLCESVPDHGNYGGDNNPTIFHEFATDVLHTLDKAFQTYQMKNLFVLFDCTAAFVRTLKWWIRDDQYLQILLPPVGKKFDELLVNDKLTIALFECLMALVENMGASFAPLASKVVEKCGIIIKTTLQQEVQFKENPNTAERPERDIMATSIDLLSAMVDGFGRDISAVLKNQNFAAVLPLILTANNNNGFHFGSQQCAFALMGECAKYCIEFLIPHLPQLMPACKQNLIHVNPSVANNASWAIGEVCIQVPEEIIQPYVGPITETLVVCIQHATSAREQKIREMNGMGLNGQWRNDSGFNNNARSGPIDHYMINNCITLGRLASVCPAEVRPQFSTFVQPWLYAMKDARIDHEKMRAFLGFCKLVKLDPEVLVNSPLGNGNNNTNQSPSNGTGNIDVTRYSHLFLLLLNIGLFDGKESPLLRNEFREILLGYREKLGASIWDNLVYRLPAQHISARIQQMVAS
ncbi:unnamed protein product [Amoebophrya sp. A120]|nr:unnamed protein product [Amoebophrya sp. A120]|eukprot:GSA120T00012570001.1